MTTITIELGSFGEKCLDGVLKQAEKELNGTESKEIKRALEELRKIANNVGGTISFTANDLPDDLDDEIVPLMVYGLSAMIGSALNKRAMC